VNGEKLTELNDGQSLVFNKTGWFTGPAYLSSEDRGKSYDLDIILSQGKKSFARKPLAAISSVVGRLYTFPNNLPIW
jgi:hypothetical protein